MALRGTLRSDVTGAALGLHRRSGVGGVRASRIGVFGADADFLAARGCA